MNKYYQLSSDSLWDEINTDFNNRGGAYVLFCKFNGIIQPINRLLGSDNKGILYIGKTISFLDRVIGLKKTIDLNMKTSSHIGGRRYNRNVKIREAFPFDNLFIQLYEHANPADLERKLLNEYFSRVGEVPPLNANDS